MGDRRVKLAPFEAVVAVALLAACSSSAHRPQARASVAPIPAAVNTPRSSTPPSTNDTSTFAPVDVTGFPAQFSFQDGLDGWGVTTACTNHYAPSQTQELCAYRAMATDDGGRTWQPRGDEQRFVYDKRSQYDDVQARF